MAIRPGSKEQREATFRSRNLLRNQPDKAKAWEDLCFARKTMRALRDEA